MQANFMFTDDSMIGCVAQIKNVFIRLQSLVLNCWHITAKLQSEQSLIKTL